MLDIHQQLLLKLAKLKIKNANRLNKIKRDFANKNKVGMISNAELLSLYRAMIKQKTIPQNTELERLLQKRKIRTLSGVAPIAVLTKPFPCPGKCSYCPNEKNMPKSYLSNEPAVMRAALTKFDPTKQVKVRLRALSENGHETDKIELIIMGGTWSYFPKSYQRSFVKRCFDACNGKVSKTLDEAQTYNETAKHRIVALTLETRPDYVTEDEVKFWRTLGATKVELGVQALDDKVLELNKRGHGLKEVIEATKLFKQAGFKVAYHMMPGLPGATAIKDLRYFKEIFSNPDFQPDLLKIYPTVVTKGTGLEKAWRAKKYKPYSVKTLFKLLVDIKKIIPDYVRIIRLIRDIPNESILAGNKITNLREALQKELIESKVSCQCIRCREARENITNLSQAKLFIEEYRASGATEYFLQYASKDKQKLYSFLRLRLPDKNETNFIDEINGCALIREVHTYGRLVPIKKAGAGIQNQGLGTRLTHKAEEIALKNGWKKIAVISGVGVRGFYRRLNYRKSGTYMTKTL